MQEKIMQYNRTHLIAPDGAVLWTVDYKDRMAALKSVSSNLGGAYDTLLKMCGSPVRSDGTAWINQTELKQKAEQLGYVSHRGCAPGFFVRLPAATYLDRAVESFNRKYFEQLDAVEINFPTVFDSRFKDTQDLTQAYEEQGMMFRLDERDDGLRLSYAADPGLFSWLRNTKLANSRLPFTVVSHTNMMRRHPGGKLGSLGKAREYKLPDMHQLTSKEGAKENLLRIVGINSESLKYWVNDNYAQFVDITEDFLQDDPQLVTDMARVADRYTLVNTFKHQPRYYRMRSGMMADSGTGAAMLYNIQWDEENGIRYNIRQDNGKSLVIIHFNALTGAGLMNTVIGRSMAGVAPKAIPAEFNPTPILLLPLRDSFSEVAQVHADRLKQKGVNAEVLAVKKSKSIGNAVWALRDRWQTAYAVIGKDEAEKDNLLLSQGHEATPVTEDEFANYCNERAKRCGHGYFSPHINLPFVG